MYKVRKYLPLMFAAYETKPRPEGEIISVEELKELDFIKSFINDDNFIKLSLSSQSKRRKLIVAEYYDFCIPIAYIDKDFNDLPKYVER